MENESTLSVSQKMSPTEIKNRDFKKVMRGYSPPEVIGFLDEVAKTWEKVQKNERVLIRKIQSLSDEIDKWKAREGELDQLKEVAKLTDERVNEIEKMYAFTMQLRIKNQVQAIIRNDPPENTLEWKTLSKIEQDTLKRILSEIGKLQSELGGEFKSSSDM